MATIKILKDDTIPAFGAFLKDSSKEGEPTILINCELHFDDQWLEYEDGEQVNLTPTEKKRALIETLMHEFGHALEEYMDVEFDEDWIDKATESYKSEYNILYDIAEYVNGEVVDGDSIMIRTPDNTSKENYDDLLYIANDIRSEFKTIKIKDLWADHDTQIITIDKINDNSNKSSK